MIYTSLITAVFAIFMAFPTLAMEKNHELLSDRNERACPICLEDYAEKSEVGVFPCSHFCCKACSSRLSECHLCRVAFDKKHIYHQTIDNLKDEYFIHWKVVSSESEDDVLAFFASLKDQKAGQEDTFTNMLNFPDAEGKTLLHHAVIKDWQRLLSALLEANAAKDVHDRKQETASDLAKRLKRRAIMRLFDPDAVTEKEDATDWPCHWFPTSDDTHNQWFGHCNVYLESTYGQHLSPSGHEFAGWNYPYPEPIVEESDEPFEGVNVSSAPGRRFYRVKYNDREYLYYVERDDNNAIVDSHWISPYSSPDFLWRPSTLTNRNLDFAWRPNRASQNLNIDMQLVYELYMNALAGDED